MVHYTALVTSHLDTDPDLPVGGEGAAEEHPAPLVPRTLVRSPHFPKHAEHQHCITAVNEVSRFFHNITARAQVFKHGPPKIWMIL